MKSALFSQNTNEKTQTKKTVDVRGREREIDDYGGSYKHQHAGTAAKVLSAGIASAIIAVTACLIAVNTTHTAFVNCRTCSDRDPLLHHVGQCWRKLRRSGEKCFVFPKCESENSDQENCRCERERERRERERERERERD